MKHELCDSWILGGLMFAAYANGCILQLIAGLAMAVAATFIARE